MQIGILFGVSMIIGFLAEIPTGAIADVYGRKVSVGLSFLLMGITWILIPLFPRFVPLLIIISFAELFATLRSGADIAWVVDFLRQNKKSSFLHDFLMHKNVVNSFGYMIGGLCSVAIVMVFGIPSTWIFAGVVCMLTAFMLFVFGKEKFKKSKAKIIQSFSITFRQARIAWEFTRNHPVLLMYILAMFLIAFSNVIAMAWQPLLVEVGMTPSSLGMMISFLGFTRLFFPLMSKMFLKLFNGNEKKSHSVVKFCPDCRTVCFCINPDAMGRE